ncbi:MAG: 50S ribosomal protein L17 [bacterium]|nr:50S ribosomal protein L17 [bacterium]
MLHHRSTSKLGREKNQRLALLRTLAVSLIKHGRIKTTEAKAKALRPFVEKMVTKARSGNLASERLVISQLGQKTAAYKLIKEVAPRMKGRPGGYLRIIKISSRRADAAPEALIEFVA